MRKAKENITGFVLAGGQSSRMGQDKGLLPLHGKTLVEHVADELQKCVAEVVIIANNSAYQQFGYQLLGDIVPDQGPMGGIYTALKTTSTDLNFIVSCDMPFITHQAVQCLIDQAGEAMVTVPMVSSRLQPLFGLYHRRCLPQVEHHVQNGKLKLQELIWALDHQIINLDQLLPQSQQLFQNLNTPQQYEEALTLKKQWI